MPILTIQHKVANYEGWKKAFDSDPMGRAKNGVTRHSILRPTDDPNYIVVNLEFATRESAEAMLTALRGMWQRVGNQIGFGAEGVNARILDEVERVEY